MHESGDTGRPVQSFFSLPTHKRLVKFSGFGVHPPTPSPKAVRVLELLPASILTNIQIQDVFSPCSSQILHHAPFAQRLTGIGILYRPSTSAALREQLMALCLCVCSYRTAKASAQAYIAVIAHVFTAPIRPDVVALIHSQ